MNEFWGTSRYYAARHWCSLAKWWQRQRWPMRFYSGGAIVVAASVLFALIGLTYRNIHQTIFEIGALLLASGILLEGYQQANKLLATSLGKVIAALLATMIGALSMGISSVLVNQATGYPPSEFPYTIAFLAPLTAGHVILLTTVVLFIVAPFFIMATGLVSLWQELSSKTKKMDGQYVKMLVRLAAAITLFVLIINTWNEQNKPYEARLVSVASWFAYTFEMYGNDPCARHKEEHVRRIESGQALVGIERNGNRAFIVRRCEPAIFQ